VRAALQQLSILGLVETRQGGGTFARRFSFASNFGDLHPPLQVRRFQDLVTIIEYRKIIEAGAAALAARTVTAEDIAAMEDLYQTMENVFDDLDAFGQADIAFHARIAAVTRNPIVIKVGEMLTDIIVTNMSDVLKLLGPDGSHRHHRAILDAFIAGDAEAARAAMVEHIDSILDHIRTYEDSALLPALDGEGHAVGAAA